LNGGLSIFPGWGKRADNPGRRSAAGLCGLCQSHPGQFPGSERFSRRRDDTTGQESRRNQRAVPITIQANAAQLFTADGKSVLGVHANGGLIGKTAPAAPGEIIVVYATGLGPTSPALIPGQSRQRRPALSRCRGLLSAAIPRPWSRPASYRESGMYTVTVQVPSNAANGDLPLILQVGRPVQRRHPHGSEVMSQIRDHSRIGTRRRGARLKTDQRSSGGKSRGPRWGRLVSPDEDPATSGGREPISGAMDGDCHRESRQTNQPARLSQPCLRSLAGPT